MNSLDRDRFGQIAGFVRVAAPVDGQIVGHELKGYYGDHGIEQLIDFGKLDPGVIDLAFPVTHADDIGAAGLGFYRIAQSLREGVIIGANHHYRCGRLD